MLERVWKAILRRGSLSLLAIPAMLLWLVSLVYRVLFRLKRATVGDPQKVKVPVIAIGNLTVGGSGKTPLVEFIARHLIDRGMRVGIVSSGYGRSTDRSFVEPGYRVQEMEASETGDEVSLLALLLPDAVYSVDRNKTAAAQRLAETNLADVIIVDDAFQHFTLARDIDIVTFDAAVRKRMLRPFPYGLLREPLTALSRADVLIITRFNLARDRSRLRRELNRLAPRVPQYRAQFVLSELVGADQRLPIKYIEDKSVFLFAGIGNFRSLLTQVDSLAGDLDFALELSDHQRYDDALLTRIKRLADKYESDMIVTTGKDWVKIRGFDFGRECYYLGLSVDLDPGEERLVTYLMERLGLEEQDS